MAKETLVNSDWRGKEGTKGCVGKSFSSLISRERMKGDKEKSTEKERE